MTVIDKKPVPLYETECRECGSRVRYKAVETINAHIDCPVCGTNIWALTVNPVDYEEGGGQMVKTSSVEVVELKHGKWLDPMIDWECSVCHKTQGYSKVFRYCPNCGAKMDLEG